MAAEFHNLQDMQHTASLVTKVFIQRDYSDGTVCRFQTKFPTELDNRIERALLEQTVKTLNSYYVEAEKVGGQSYLEGCLACATAYIVFFCMETRYEKVLKKISGYIQEQNEKIYAPRGLLLTDPIERGMRVVSLTLQLPYSLRTINRTVLRFSSGLAIGKIVCYQCICQRHKTGSKKNTICKFLIIHFKS
ncbi:golgin subfamily A member 7 isoform X1 [Fundulus heteroclitus]|uniref:golgin subfamily A member 7 isoform X1 n=1 Tax=Fundulus heteroclitus TaxID=8078 RepID=UPI00165A83B9|nr:golgin subfamily A member 7 isoform X1 [Fundulus heteroclitus]